MYAFLPVPERVAFTVFGLDIMWYAIMLTTGTVIGAFFTYKRAPKYGLSKDNCLDYFIYCVPTAVICARLYYVIFEWSSYKDDLAQILNFRGGGLAIHGALIGGLGMAVLLCKKFNNVPLKIVDLAMPGYAIGQAIGRWGNYFNSEAHGGPTDLPWAIECQGELVHPTFLYESIWCLLLFIFFMYLEKKGYPKFDGQFLCLYGILYSAERFFVEGLRTDSLYIGNFRQAQVISVFTIVVCLAIYFPLKKRGKKEIPTEIPDAIE